MSVSVNKCCVLNVGKITHNTCFSINDAVLSVVDSTCDLGVLVTHDLSPSTHISNIVAKAHNRPAAIFHTFKCQNIDMLLHAYIVYIRPLVEHDSVIWSPFTVKDIETIESVQCRFIKLLPGLSCFTYHERLRINIPSLELSRLHLDLIWCYKILFKHVD